MRHGVQKHSLRSPLDAATAAQVAETMQALAAPSRVRILGRLRDGSCSVNELAQAVAMEASAVSHQLRLLRHLGLVIGERRGRRGLRAPRFPRRRPARPGRLPRRARPARLPGTDHRSLVSHPNARDVVAQGADQPDPDHDGQLHNHEHSHDHDHRGSREHGHSHGLVDRSILRSRKGIKAVSLSLGVLALTALSQAAIFLSPAR